MLGNTSKESFYPVVGGNVFLKNEHKMMPSKFDNAVLQQLKTWG